MLNKLKYMTIKEGTLTFFRFRAERPLPRVLATHDLICLYLFNPRQFLDTCEIGLGIRRDTWDRIMTLGLPVLNGVSKSYPYIISASYALDTCATTVGDNVTFEHIFSLAWVSRETHNLQRVFRPGGGG